MSLIEIQSETALASEISKAGGGGDGGGGVTKSVLLFGADWHEACPMLRMVLGALAASNPGILFGDIDVDAASASGLSERFGVTSVPTILLLVSGKTRERLEGEVLSDPSHVTLAVQRLANAAVEAAASAAGGGDAAAASSAAAEGSSSGETREETKRAALNDRLERLITADTIMLFMKGTPDTPRCGFSRQAIEILRAQDVPFGSFDILTDDDVRQGLKTYSDWPTYPQIYVRGELMGGLDILKETVAEGSLKEDWEISDLTTASSAAEMAMAMADTGGTAGSPTPSPPLEDRLKKLVNRHTVMLFMKGLPSNPQCGFSRQIVEILDSLNGDGGVAYDAFNVFEDEEVRQGLKTFSDWPTYPQLYHRGELLGGLDIVRELNESGELEELLRE